jgi:tyrosine-protein phosphatase YwqE
MAIKTEYICDICGAKSEEKNFLKKLSLELQINGNVVIQINKDICPDCSGNITDSNTKNIKKAIQGILENNYQISLSEDAAEIPEELQDVTEALTVQEKDQLESEAELIENPEAETEEPAPATSVQEVEPVEAKVQPKGKNK